jgi:hypothetical protein
MFRFLAHIIFAIFFLCFSVNEEKYDKIFTADYAKALVFTQGNYPLIKKCCSAKGNDPALLSSVVFPELIRYSFLQDLMETSALEYMYVDYGSGAANFSVGVFQMKPSFVEELEQLTEEHYFLNQKYPEVISFSATDEKSKRKERIKRLSVVDWQITYVNCFISYLSDKYKSKTFSSFAQQVAFYACAYNGGFRRSEDEIEKLVHKKQFPYGKNYKGEQYSYGRIAAYFYTKHYKQLITSSTKPKPSAQVKAR